MLAAIEIYNKPLFKYRDECFCILLVNGWELLAKAILSRNKQRIMYTKKEAGVSYRTYALSDALRKAKRFFPECIPYEPVRENINHLVKYRDNAVHYYNESGFGVMIYGLAQASLVTYRDLVLHVFGLDITQETTIVLLPLGFGASPDPIEFLRSKQTNPSSNKAVAKFLRELIETSKNLGDRGFDAGRFLTYFDVSLNSVKKITAADITVAIQGTSSNTNGTTIVEKRVNSNATHDLTRKDIFDMIGDKINGINFTSYTLSAIIWKYDIKDRDDYFFSSKGGGSFQYSRNFVKFLRELTKFEVEDSLKDYKRNLSEKTMNR